jgi:dynein heavy chain, axonemal
MRAGMVYLEPHRLGWEPLLASWLAKLKPVVGADLCALFERLFKWQLAACLRFVRKEVKEQSPTEDSALATMAMRLIESMLDEFRPVEKASAGGAGADSAEASTAAASPDDRDGTAMVPGPAHALDAATKIKWVEAVFVFAVVWAVGATGGSEDRARFDAFFRQLTSGVTPQVLLLPAVWHCGACMALPEAGPAALASPHTCRRLPASGPPCLHVPPGYQAFTRWDMYL